jgi:hypothetical protein
MCDERCKLFWNFGFHCSKGENSANVCLGIRQEDSQLNLKWPNVYNSIYRCDQKKGTKKRGRMKGKKERRKEGRMNISYTVPVVIGKAW